MGQQQLLLIVLGVMIVGIAIAVGFGMFHSGSITVNRDSMVNDMNMIASSAQQHYVRPAAIGGGGGTFDGYAMPQRLSKTGNGEYRVDGTGASLEVVGESLLHENVSITLRLTMGDDGWSYNWDWQHDGL
jgi:hypothetical protein